MTPSLRQRCDHRDTQSLEVLSKQAHESGPNRIVLAYRCRDCGRWLNEIRPESSESASGMASNQQHKRT